MFAVGDDAVVLVVLAVLRRFFEFLGVRHVFPPKFLTPVADGTGADDNGRRLNGSSVNRRVSLMPFRHKRVF